MEPSPYLLPGGQGRLLPEIPSLPVISAQMWRPLHRYICSTEDKERIETPRKCSQGAPLQQESSSEMTMLACGKVRFDLQLSRNTVIAQGAVQRSVWAGTWAQAPTGIEPRKAWWNTGAQGEMGPSQFPGLSQYQWRFLSRPGWSPAVPAEPDWTEQVDTVSSALGIAEGPA